jgi:hypothetical protein
MVIDKNAFSRREIFWDGYMRIGKPLILIDTDHFDTSKKHCIEHCIALYTFTSHVILKNFVRLEDELIQLQYHTYIVSFSHTICGERAYDSKNLSARELINIISRSR